MPPLSSSYGLYLLSFIYSDFHHRSEAVHQADLVLDSSPDQKNSFRGHFQSPNCTPILGPQASPRNRPNDHRPPHVRPIQPAGMLLHLLFLVHCRRSSPSQHPSHSSLHCEQNRQILVARFLPVHARTWSISLGQEIPVPRIQDTAGRPFIFAGTV